MNTVALGKVLEAVLDVSGEPLDIDFEDFEASKDVYVVDLRGWMDRYQFILRLQDRLGLPSSLSDESLHWRIGDLVAIVAGVS